MLSRISKTSKSGDGHEQRLMQNCNRVSRNGKSSFADILAQMGQEGGTEASKANQSFPRVFQVSLHVNQAVSASSSQSAEERREAHMRSKAAAYEAIDTLENRRTTAFAPV